jgi:hypothetical protein
MVAWSVGMQLRCDEERGQEEEALRIATERKWATAAYKRRISLLQRRRAFYEKIQQALEAGYVIVPNFEMNVFAIRTDASKPKQTTSTRSWEEFRQQPRMLAAGEGDYVNPLPEVFQKQVGQGEHTSVVYFPESFEDVDFPIALAKPALMERTAEAMAMKVFDEIGVAVDAGSRIARGKGDPIILGRIRNPRENRPALTFFLAWYFDPTNI